jgi:hypothetical protein
LEKVSSWVGRRLKYVPGSSDPIDGAADTLLAGEGVCRDYAHLVVAFDNHGGAVTLDRSAVTAIVDGELPKGSIDQLVSIT